jgi:hypothetical protein
MSDHTQPAFAPAAPSRPEAPAQRGEISARERWGRWAFTGIAWIFAACVAAQVFLAGMATFAGPTWWTTHTSFVHLFEPLPVLMLIAAFVGGLSARLKWLSAAAFVLIGLQYALIQLSAAADRPELAALHPVNALAIFWLGLYLATRRLA